MDHVSLGDEHPVLPGVDVLGEQFRASLTKAHGLPAARLHLPQEEDPHRDQKQHWEPVDEDTHQGGHAVIRWFHIHIDVVLKHTRCQLRVIVR